MLFNQQIKLYMVILICISFLTARIQHEGLIIRAAVVLSSESIHFLIDVTISPDIPSQDN